MLSKHPVWNFVWIEGNVLVLLHHWHCRMPLHVVGTVDEHLLMLLHLLLHARLILAHDQTLIVPGLGIHVTFASHCGPNVALLRHDVHCVTHVLIGKLRLLAHLVICCCCCCI